jgi:tetratricopeptide (TPR) repeat protein
MARESALTAAPELSFLRRPTRPLSQLWQLPMFLAGVVAILVVALGRPLWRNAEQRIVDRSLTTLSRALDQGPAELRAAIEQVEQNLDRFERVPARRGEAHFLLGQANVRLAEDASAAAAADRHATAAGFWNRAREYLEEAERLGVPERHQPQLAYLLGKTWHHLGVEPERVIASLTAALEAGGGDQAEGFGLLAETYLRLPEPNLRAALAANQRQLAAPSLDDRILAAGRLRRAELHLRLEEPDEARKVLKHLLEQRTPFTPRVIVARARSLLAQCYQSEGAWKEAQPLLEETLQDPETPAAERGRILYYLGHCYLRAGQDDRAATAWDEARRGGGDEAQAAALALAELRLPTDSARALELFTAALQGISTATDYHNSLVDLTAARAVFERACRHACDTGAFAVAQQLARLYERLAVAGRGQFLFAVAADAWARHVLAHAVPDPSGRIPEKDRTLACEQYRLAAVAYETAAGLGTDSAEKAQRLWLSADRYLQARDPEQAVLVLQRYVQLPALAPERLGEAWYLIGEAHRAAQHGVAAAAAYLKALEYPGPFAFRARYRLAMAEVERGNLEEAETHLRQTLQLMQTAPDSETLENCLYALGNLLFQRGDYRLAEIRLHEALERYPANANAVPARLQLARCCRVLAEQEARRVRPQERASTDILAHYRLQHHRWLEKAAVHYLKIVDDLLARQAAERLPPDDDLLLRQASFALADCRFAQGQYDEARRLYEKLADAYRNQVDGLIALWHVWRCALTPPARPELARGAYQRIQTSLQEMPPAAFDGTDATRTRQWWEEWLAKNRP